MVRPSTGRRRGAAAVSVALTGGLLGTLMPAIGHPQAAPRIPQKTGPAPRARRDLPIRTITVAVDGKERVLRTRANTIREALDEAETRLGPHDAVWPPLLSPLYDGTTILVTRQTVREETVIEKIPYRTRLETTRSRWQRYPIVKRHGQEGRAEARYAVTYRAGKPVERRLLSRRVLEPSIPKLVQLPASRALASRGVLGGRRVFRMVATAYDPGPLSCGPKANGRTAIGLKAGHGVVAVDPRVIPLNSRLYIEGYGYAIAGDVGSAIKGHRIDLGYVSRREALQFGRREVLVYVLD